MDATQMPTPNAFDHIEVAGQRLEFYWTRPPKKLATTTETASTWLPARSPTSRVQTT